MVQSKSTPYHTAIIMDGNGRWAAARGLPRLAGHRAGAAALRRVVEAAPGLEIRTLTLYAFSSDNWQRPKAEVEGLMQLLASQLCSEAMRCAANEVRITMIGRRDRLPDSVLRAANFAERVTRAGSRLHLRLAIDYSARDAIVSAARHSTEATCEMFSRAIGEDVDLLIRTGGEQRLSDFLLWESAYAELVFTTRQWPDFDGEDLRAATETFAARDRRFGRTSPTEQPISAHLGQLTLQDEQAALPYLRRDRWLR